MVGQQPATDYARGNHSFQAHPATNRIWQHIHLHSLQTAYVPGVLAQTIETVEEVTGLDIVDIIKANTYDAKAAVVKEVKDSTDEDLK